MGRRAAGISVPLHSLRSKQGRGVGEFLDLIPLANWASSAGLKIIQLLPINDNNGGYPYSIVSAFALHPLYLNIEEIDPAVSLHVEEEPHLHYKKIIEAKLRALRKLFEKRGEKDLSSEAFARFFARAKEHLLPYAAYYALRERFGTDDFTKWGEYAVFSAVPLEEICEGEEAKFVFFHQFHLDRQLKMAIAHMKKVGIALHGDFPIGVERRSVEAWRFYSDFRWEKSVGAPPDFYNSKGQNWGFPSFDFEKMEKGHFSWLIGRLKWMEQYFDGVRIDHVLGYFRLWEIPKGETSALEGHFHPAIPYTREEIGDLPIKGLFIEDGGFHPRVTPKREVDRFKDWTDRYFLVRQEGLWEEAGRKKLCAMLEGTTMELIAEDIGVIPDCVGIVLKELGIPNTRVQRMPKSFALEFEDPKDWPENCYCMPSNHDTAPLREWWEEDPERNQRYFEQILREKGNAPTHLTEELAEKIVEAHLDSSAQGCLFLLQDLFALSDELKVPLQVNERINDPANPRYHWNWRMHLYLEELQLAKSFTNKIQEMIQKGKR